MTPDDVLVQEAEEVMEQINAAATIRRLADELLMALEKRRQGLDLYQGRSSAEIMALQAAWDAKKK